MEKIEATTKLKENESYKLEDKDYLLIKAIQELTNAIYKLTARMQR
jgi:hypothetical protein